MSPQDTVIEAYRAQFGTKPRCMARAPGRVNLIGDHTDYNGGFVLPMAIDRSLWIAFEKRNDRRVIVSSLDFEQTAEFSLDQAALTDCGWLAYVQAVALALEEQGATLQGWQGVMRSDVPVGAGLSSSAAVELAAARAFARCSNLEWDAPKMARLCQRAENNWVGVQCGIMDQMIVAVGREGQALLIDCRSLETESIPLPPGTSVVILDTATRRSLADAAYNERRAACESAARSLGIAALRDADLDQLNLHNRQLDPTTFRRARHVISENERTVRAAAAMRLGDAVTLGKLMIGSHASLRDDYEVSSPALNAIVDCALLEPDCYGARMTGAGFGGCAVALISTAAADRFARNVADSYSRATGNTPQIYVCLPAAGAEVIEL